ncbi:MAG: hypothetical protein AAF965_09430 [Pseudomonadota bacterium]
MTVEPRKWPKTIDLNAFRARWLASESLQEVADWLGCTRGYVSTLAQIADLPGRRRLVYCGKTVQTVKRPSKLDHIDDALFAFLWGHNVGKWAMANHFAIQPDDVFAKARRLRLPDRPKGWRPLPDKNNVRFNALIVEFEKQRRRRSTQMVRSSSTNDRWPLDRDARIVQSQGRYRALCELADDWDMPIRTVQARWHVLRVAP